MADQQDVVKRLSGGAAEADPNNALGGVMSSVQVDSQTAVYDAGGIAGVTLIEALGHSLDGSGTLSFTFATTELDWNPLSGTAGIAVDVSIDGTYIIAGNPGEEYLEVDVVAASLPGIDASDGVTVTHITAGLFANIGGIEAALGSTKYRCFYIRNDHVADTLMNVSLWITRQPSDTGAMVAIGLDPVGIGDGSATGVAVTIVDEDTAPVGVVFTAPITQGTALQIGNLLTGEVQAVWVRRTIGPNEQLQTVDDRWELTIGASF